ncbi:17845_t:CDS:2, partial [Racocetra persica]
GAEDLFEDAKSKGQEILGEDFNDTEKRRIDKESHTPEGIQTILKDIPVQRRKLAWDKFFREREGDSRINKDPNGLINKDKIIEVYTTETIVKGQKYPKTTKNINPLKHLAEEVDQAHDFIVKEIDLQTDLDKFPTNEIIEDQRIAYDNGWATPSEIKEGKTNYQNIKNIEVLKIKKQDIDQEIQKVDNLVKQINSYKYLRDLDANQAQIDKQFSELKTDLLPPNKSQQIKEAEKAQRNNLFYYLTDPKDGGLEETTLKKLSSNLQNT